MSYSVGIPQFDLVGFSFKYFETVHAHQYKTKVIDLDEISVFFIQEGTTNWKMRIILEV